MMLMFLLICWILYALYEGKRDGFYYHYRNTSRDPKNENIHWVYTIQRTLFIMLQYFVLDDKNRLVIFLFIGGLILIFSFLHNGYYYYTRNKLDPFIYQDGWMSNSVSSEATIELKFTARLFLFIIGIVSIGVLIFIA